MSRLTFVTGPMLSGALGIRTLDLGMRSTGLHYTAILMLPAGNATMGMHSIREAAGVYDVEYAVRLFKGFYERYTKLEAKVRVD